MTVFDVDFNVLVRQLLPVRLRQAVTLAWLKCLVAPVKWIHSFFMVNRQNNLYLLSHNGQVCYLEAALNDIFDPDNRRIFIDDPLFRDPVYTYLINEEKPVFLGLVSEIGVSSIPAPNPVPLYLESELYNGGGTSFIINVPLVLSLTPGQMARFTALVDRYKLPARLYDIVFF